MQLAACVNLCSMNTDLQWHQHRFTWHCGRGRRVACCCHWPLPALGTASVSIAAGRCCRRLGQLTTRTAASVGPVPSIGQENLCSLCTGIVNGHFMLRLCTFQVDLCMFHADSMQVLCGFYAMFTQIYAFICTVYAIFMHDYVLVLHILCMYYV
jgi:hypothetical protein